MNILRQSTVYTFRAGQFVSSTDGSTAQTGLTIAQADIQISKAGGAFAQTSASSPTTTHDADGFYQCPLTTTDTATVGTLKVQILMAGALIVEEKFQVIEEAIYDALYAGSATGLLPTNVTQFGGTAGTFASGRPEVNTTHAAGTAWASAAIASVTALGAQAKADVNAECDTAISDAGIPSISTIAEVVHGARNVYFVKDSGGSDSNSGLTPDLAFATWGKAASVAVSGDVVLPSCGFHLIASPITFAAGVKIIGLGAMPLVAGGVTLGDFSEIANCVFLSGTLTTAAYSRVRNCELLAVTIAGTADSVIEDCVITSTTVNRGAALRRCKIVLNGSEVVSISSAQTLHMQNCIVTRHTGSVAEAIDLVASSSKLVAHDCQFLDRFARNSVSGLPTGICIVGGDGELNASNCTFKAMGIGLDSDQEFVAYELELGGTIQAYLQNCVFDLNKVAAGVTIHGGVTFSAVHSYYQDTNDSQDEYEVLWWCLGPNGERLYIADASDCKIQVIDEAGDDKIAADTEMTAIDDTGGFEYVAEEDERLELGQRCQVIFTATIFGAVRTYRDWVGRDS